MSQANSVRICSLEDCERPYLASGFCRKHYQRWHKHGDPRKTAFPRAVDRLPVAQRMGECKVDGCVLRPRSRGYCGTHYARIIRNGTLELKVFECRVVGCMRRYGSGGYCQMHKIRVDKYGDPGPVYAYPPKVLGPEEYVFVTVNSIRVMEHRYVMSQMIGRPLMGKENVHHLNGDKHDNRPENLELWSSDQPPGQRVDDKVKFAVELLTQYAPHLLTTT